MTPHETACSSGRGANRIRTGVSPVSADMQGKRPRGTQLLEQLRRKAAA